MAKATVRGMDSVNGKFAAMSNAMKGKALEQAGLAGMLPIVNEAKITVHKVSGNLARSIHAQTAETSERRAIVRGGTDVEYAAAEELGNEFRPPHPYLRPAFDNQRRAAMDEVRETLKQIVRASAK